MTEPENQAEALAKLRKEYRPTMDAEVLHSWAADVVAALASLPEAPAVPVGLPLSVDEIETIILATEPIVVWAWRPREDWPDETAALSSSKQKDGEDA